MRFCVILKMQNYILLTIKYKQMKNILIIFLGLLLMSLAGCVKEVAPANAITTESLITSPENLKNAVNGGYSLFKDHLPFNGQVDDNLMYLRQYFQMSDFSSDDIVCGQVTEDPLFLSFSLGHTPLQTNSRYFWYISYKIISGMNTVISAMEGKDNLDAASSQLLGECYFLRAFVYFNLVRFYALPYTHNPDAPGIILRNSLSDPSIKARSTVKEVYNAVVADALKGADLMNKSRGVMYGSKEAAWALLSRVYLYENNNDSTIYYSDKVINSGKFLLETADTYPSLFANATTARETIFCIAFTTAEDYGKFGSIASMIYSDGNSGWGEEYVTEKLRTLMNQHGEDVRQSYIVPLKDDNGDIQKKNGIDIYYISKFSFQNGSPTLSSPIMFRLAEMYLNRAEAYAKAGNTQQALDNVDMIRKNRGLQASLYNGTVPLGQTLLGTVLNERRMELAFEGHRNFDVYRNKMDMNRVYWGYHIPSLKESDIDPSVEPAGYPNTTVNWQNPRIIYYIPIDEITANNLCVQNQ